LGLLGRVRATSLGLAEEKKKQEEEEEGGGAAAAEATAA